jgi:hypothetical protein
VDLYYARAYMTERLEEAQNQRLVRSIQRDPTGPSAVARYAEQRFGSLRRLMRPAPGVLGSAQITEADCCTT